MDCRGLDSTLLGILGFRERLGRAEFLLDGARKPRAGGGADFCKRVAHLILVAVVTKLTL